MTDKGHIDKLARIIADRARQQTPPRLTGSTTAGGTDLLTRQDRLPVPIGSAGEVLTVVSDGGDLVPSWEAAAGGTTDAENDANSFFISTAGGNQTHTLPTAVGIDGRRFFVKKTTGDANTVTVDTTSSQTIDGALTYVISAQWAGVMVQSDGANYMIVGELI